MLEFKISADLQAKIEAKRAARAALEKRRDEEAAAAYVKALEEVDGDETRLIIHPIPGGFGGATIHRVPSPEFWALQEKQILTAITSEGKKASYAATTAALVENNKLLVHPSLSELQAWAIEQPGLYGRIKSEIEARVEHGNVLGKSMTWSAAPVAPQGSSPG